MAANDISAGLKNALERGSNIEDAIASFVNAGYSEGEVREAAKLLTEGSASEVLYGEKVLQSPAVNKKGVLTPPLPQKAHGVPMPNHEVHTTQSLPHTPVTPTDSAKKKQKFLIIGIILGGIIVAALVITLITILL